MNTNKSKPVSGASIKSSPPMRNARTGQTTKLFAEYFVSQKTIISVSVSGMTNRQFHQWEIPSSRICGTG